MIKREEVGVIAATTEVSLVAALGALGDRPLVGLIGQGGSDRSDGSGLVGEDPQHVGAALDLLAQSSLWSVGRDLRPVFDS